MDQQTATESYLNLKRIIEIAKQSGSDAIHPGYGFLSENEGFAKACKKSGIIFIGPGSEVMEVTGDKMKCKEVMKEAGVPLVPGSDGVVDDLDEAVAIAKDSGFPVLLKSAFGGGGRGIRLAKDEKELRQEYEMASAESKAAFGKAHFMLKNALRASAILNINLFAIHTATVGTYSNVNVLCKEDIRSSSKCLRLPS